MVWRVRVQVVEVSGYLDHPSSGERSGVCRRPGIGAHAGGEFLGEQVGQPGQHVLHQGLVGVVRRLVQPGGRYHDHVRGPGHCGELVGPPPQPERRPLHHRPPAQRGEGPELADGGVRVGELLTGQLRAAEEQVVMRIADAQVSGRHVTQHGPDQRQPWYSSSVTCSPQ